MDCSLVDSTLQQSENITLAHFLVVSSSSCCWPAVRGVTYTILGRSLLSAHVHCTEIMGARTVNNSCISVATPNILLCDNVK